MPPSHACSRYAVPLSAASPHNGISMASSSLFTVTGSSGILTRFPFTPFYRALEVIYDFQTASYHSRVALSWQERVPLTIISTTIIRIRQNNDSKHQKSQHPEQRNWLLTFLVSVAPVGTRSAALPLPHLRSFLSGRGIPSSEARVFVLSFTSTSVTL